jgi:hypothetical protein
MKTDKKVGKRVLAEELGYHASQAKLNEKQRRGYRRPGSRNPRKRGA